jgi:predicted dehydrogenase
VAFVDIKAENIAAARALNPRLPESRCFTSLDDALAQVEADAVIIITPPQLHTQQCLAAIRAGKHVLVEKPLTMSLAEARQVMAAADQRGVKVCVGQQALYNGGNATLARLVAEKKYGRPGCGLMVKYGWRPKVHHSGKQHHAYLWERGVHDFDTMRAIFNEEVRRVSAISFNPPWSPYQHGAGNHVWVEFESGATCGYSCSFATYGPGWATRVDCEKASLVEANKEKEIHIFAPDAKEPEKIKWDVTPSPETIILDGWARYIKEGVEPRFGGHENLKTLALCEAVGISADEGRVVEPATL